MSTHKLKNVILSSITHFPNQVNNLLLKMNNFPKLIYGAKYWNYIRELETKYYHEYDNSHDLLNIVNYAIENVPYYSAKYCKRINSVEEFRSRFEFIDKDTVMREPSIFVSKEIELSKYDKVTTGGTSGKPLTLLVPFSRYITELGTMHFLWKKAGFNYGARAVLRNHKLDDDTVNLINPITKEYIFNNFKLNADYVKQIYNVIQRNHVGIIHAYPSAAYQFCLMCKDQGLDLSFIKAFLCGSEGVLDFQYKLIVDDLGLKLYNWYGHSEKLVLGGYCEHVNHYHMEKRYGFFELIDDDGLPVATAGEVGEIVGTTLNNKGMPLIRYRTSDYAEYVGDYCDKCKRHMPIIKSVQGRREKNNIYKKDGTYITTTALNLHGELYEVIDGLQYIQNCAGHLRVLIIKGANFKEHHGKDFYKHYKESMGEDSEVAIEYVDKLIHQTNGKFLFLISNIK